MMNCLNLKDKFLLLMGEKFNWLSDEDGDSWETVGPRNKTAITRKQSFIPSKLSEIFGGQLKSVAELVSASKSVKILELPDILILHLMRFSYGSQGSTKLLKPVYFPLELVLNRELLVLPITEGRKYELVATITHHGREPSKGHYTSDILHTSGKWLRYDDASHRLLIFLSTKWFMTKLMFSSTSSSRFTRI
ncbi:putative ubiquitinyl hydrolase 1 [Helianthus annuus]|nr:putative ubiquitinyl hydrolase 1 [Helianthus annuus]